MVKLRAGVLLAAALMAGGGVARAERPRVMVLPIAGDQVEPGLRARVTRAIGNGLQDSGVEVVPAPADPSPTAIAKALADPAGPTFVLRGSVEAEGRSYTFRLEMVDGKSAAVLANREDRCEICTEAEALETANTAASTLKSQAFNRSGAAKNGPPAAAGAAAATNLRVRVVVAEALDLPPSLDEFHGKIRAAIETLVHDAGLGLAVPPPGSAARCTTRDCMKELALTVGATDVMAVSGSRNDVQGFALALELWNASSDENAKSQGWCNFCTGPQMVTAAQDLGRPLLAQLATRSGATPVVAAGANLAPTAEVPAPRSTARTALSWIGIGVGAAAVATGVFLLAKHGQGTCNASGPAECPNSYPGVGVGIAVVGVGAAAAAAGIWGLLSTQAESPAPASHARLDLGPGWLDVRGTF
jgi:hypothetical protein